MDFLSLYLQVPVFLILYFGWKIRRRSQLVDLKSVDLQADQYEADEETQALFDASEERRRARLRGTYGWRWRAYYWLV
jgi:amino acid permease